MLTAEMENSLFGKLIYPHDRLVDLKSYQLKNFQRCNDEKIWIL